MGEWREDLVRQHRERAELVHLALPAVEPEQPAGAEAGDGVLEDTLEMAVPTVERFAALATAMGVIVWTAEPDGTARDGMPAWRAYTGQRVDEVAGNGWLAALHPEDRTRIATAWAAQTAAAHPFELTCRVRRWDGVYRDVQLRAAPVRMADGRVREWVCACADVTDVVRRERAEKQAERVSPLGAIFEAIADGIFVYDLDGRIVQSNTAGRVMFALDADPVYATLPLRERMRRSEFRDEHGRVLAPDEWPQARTLHGEVLTGPHLSDYLVRALDGREVHTNVSGAPIRDATGVITGAVCIFRDVTKRRQLEGEVTERARELETVLAAMADGVAVYDTFGNMLLINRAGRELFGFDDLAPDLLEQSAGERMRHLGLLDAEGNPLGPEQWPLAGVLHGEPLTGSDAIDVRRLTEDGREVQISLSGTPVFDADGRIVRVVSVARDVTERRRLEHEVAERASTLESVFEAMADSVFVFDREDRIVTMNAAARALLERYGREEYTRVPVHQWAVLRDEDGEPIPPERFPTARILHGETLTGAGAAEMLARTADGRDFWLSISGAPVRDLDGSITGAVWVVRDVTGRRQLEQRTREALDALLEMAETLVMPPGEATAPAESAMTTKLAGASGQGQTAATELERTARRLASLGLSVLGCERIALASVEPETDVMMPVTMVGMSPDKERAWWASWPPNITLAGRMSAAVAARLHAGEAVVIDPRLPEHAERLRPYGVGTLLVTPLQVGEAIVGAMAVEYGTAEHDYTQQEAALAQAVAKLAALVFERERLLRERAEAQGKMLALHEANRRMDDFLSIASHELRTPVTVIKANLQILARRPGELREIDKRLLERTGRQINRLTRLVDDLVDVSRIRAGRLDLQEAQCDLVAVVAEAAEEQRLAHPEREISLALPQGGVLVHGDPDRLGQVVTNYLTNALKYSNETEPVAVRLRVDGGHARVEVADRGPGLGDEAREHVWDLFYRAPDVEVLSGSGVGLGLGLHISKTLIERHGGQVGVESEVGEGSTFWFTLPLTEQAIKHAPD
jgi:PAS domain S-box-containing protein